MALLNRERIEQNVVQRVLRWAALGASRAADADVADVLAEDAAEVGALFGS